jgi:hypothetical protein
VPVSERSVKKSNSFLLVFLNYVAFDSCPDVLPQAIFMFHLHGRTRTKRKSPLRRSCPSALSRHLRRGRFLRLKPEDAIRNV